MSASAFRVHLCKLTADVSLCFWSVFKARWKRVVVQEADVVSGCGTAMKKAEDEATMIIWRQYCAGERQTRTM